MTLCTAALWTVALGTAVPAAPAPALAATPAASPAAPATRSAPEQAALTRGRALMAEFLAVNLGPLWPSFSPAVRAQWGTLEGFTAFRRTGIEQYGAELRVVRERTFMQGGEAVYVRSAIFEKAPQQVWAFVVGFTGPQVTTFGVLLEQDRSDDPVGRAAALRSALTQLFLAGPVREAEGVRLRLQRDPVHALAHARVGQLDLRGGGIPALQAVLPEGLQHAGQGIGTVLGGGAGGDVPGVRGPHRAFPLPGRLQGADLGLQRADAGAEFGNTGIRRRLARAQRRGQQCPPYAPLHARHANAPQARER